MLIKYTFANGETSEVEVSEEIGRIVIDSRKAEHAQKERDRYYCPYSYDAIDYEGSEYATEDTPESLYEQSVLNENLYAGLQNLTETQKRRLLLLAEGYSMREIARIENKEIKTIIESIDAARKKIKKFLD